MYVWWHAAPAPGTYGAQPLADEPPLGKTTVSTSGTAAASSACPDSASVARCFSDTLTYYLVRRAGDSDAAVVSDGRIAANVEKDISVRVGDTISFITD